MNKAKLLAEGMVEDFEDFEEEIDNTSLKLEKVLDWVSSNKDLIAFAKKHGLKLDLEKDNHMINELRKEVYKIFGKDL